MRHGLLAATALAWLVAALAWAQQEGVPGQAGKLVGIGATGGVPEVRCRRHP